MADARPGFGGPWKVVSTRVFDHWFAGLGPEHAMQVEAAMRRLEKDGPVLGRPRVDSIRGARFHNLKELRVQGSIRVLFAFDPKRQAVMLVGGDKNGRWNRWYRQQIRNAERLYDDHLRLNGISRSGPSRPGPGRQRGRQL